MRKIYYIMGKSSSGKDTIYRRLLAMINAEPIVPYTTRPMRENEVDGRDYHFTDKAGFERMKAEGRVVEYRIYPTVHGEWIYFTAEDSISAGRDCIGIGTLESYVKMRERYGEELVPIYVEVDDYIRLSRALEREHIDTNPKYAEMCRRFLSDSADFSEENLKAAGIDRRFSNNGEASACLAAIVEYINLRSK